MSSKKSKKKNASFSSDMDMSNFSPVGTPKEQRHGNLTGNERIVKDIAADWHNLVKKWDAANAAGVDIVNRIANSKLQHVYDNGDEGKPVGDMPADMRELFEILEKIYEKMKKIIKKMTAITASLKGVSDLSLHLSRDDTSETCLFQTWPVSLFYETSRQLLDMYTQEFNVKKVVVENVAHVNERQLMMFYTTTWLQQPYITDRAQVMLEAMLHETGHR